jgi:hypothetical protein
MEVIFRAYTPEILPSNHVFLQAIDLFSISPSSKVESGYVMLQLSHGTRSQPNTEKPTSADMIGGR